MIPTVINRPAADRKQMICSWVFPKKNKNFVRLTKPLKISLEGGVVGEEVGHCIAYQMAACDHSTGPGVSDLLFLGGKGVDDDGAASSLDCTVRGGWVWRAGGYRR